MNDRFLAMPHVEARKLADSVRMIRAAKLEGKNICWEEMFNVRQPYRVDERGIAHIHLYGPMAKGLDPIWRILGATDYDDVGSELKLAGDPKVKGAIVRSKTPGGSTVGLKEGSEALAALAASKPVVVISEELNASAGVYLTAGATEIWATHSSVQGCIGTICSWYSYGNMLEELGITPVTFTSEGADLKQEGTSDREPTEEEAKHIQSVVDGLGKEFRDWVKLCRGDVPAEAMRGQTFNGSEAKAFGLVDYVGGEDAAYESLLYHVGS